MGVFKTFQHISDFSTSVFILNTFNIEHKHLKLLYYTRKSIDVSLPIRKDGSTSNHKNDKKYPNGNQKSKTAKYWEWRKCGRVYIDFTSWKHFGNWYAKNQENKYKTWNETTNRTKQCIGSPPRVSNNLFVSCKVYIYMSLHLLQCFQASQ